MGKTYSKNFQGKLKSYSVLAGSILAGANTNTADAQVVYTDVAPDSLINLNQFYDLDLNNDDIFDFQLVQRSGTYGGIASYDVVGVYALAANNAVDTSGGSGTATAFDIGTTIDASLNWVDSTEMAAISPPTANALAALVPLFGISAGNFLGTTGKFLPLRFEYPGGGGSYYGWVRLNVAADAKSFVVVDYAYNDDVNAYSITGQLIGISEAGLANKVSIYSYDKNINVKLDPLVPLEGTVSITNLAGQVISETTIKNSEMTIPMQQAKTGVYMVSIKQSNGSYTKRVLIK